MAYRLIIKENALLDTIEAFLYYEAQLDGLGEKFMSALQNRYDQIVLNPEHNSFIDKRKKLRDIKLKGFPYVVIYDIAGDVVNVYVVHNSYKKQKRLL